MPRALKVFRTAIGFHDAYVAAPSRKAALAAWGADKDLFAREAAEQVTDPALTAEPLRHPGEVIRVLRGSRAAHVEALGRIGRKKPAAKAEKPEAPLPAARPAPRKRPPKPSRGDIAEAERALHGYEKRAEARLAELAQRESTLAAERRRLEHDLADERARHEARVQRATEAYHAALGEWEDSA